ncbi:MAG: hypothetical protein HW405_805, partial [Candidatus Berkelbacteria bacterium]|nr:hypothetical protein [Candidatus Berkelbacteria bacterium]
LIPDNQSLWILPAVVAGLKIIKKEKIKVILTSSAAYSDHIVALILKEITGILWVADFRDLWTQNPEMKFKTVLHRKICQYLEKRVLSEADEIITVSDGLQSNFQKIVPRHKDKFKIIANGVDLEDFKGIFAPQNNRYLTFAHIGFLYGSRTIDIFCKALDDLDQPNIKTIFLGTAGNVKKQKVVSHKRAIREMLKADVLLLVIGKNDRRFMMTSKIFEYLAARKPILAIAPEDSAVSQLIKNLKVGWVVDPQDIKTLKKTIKLIYQQFLKKDLKIPEIDLLPYSRLNKTQELSEVLNKIINRPINICLIGNLDSPQNQLLVRNLQKNNCQVSFISTQDVQSSGVKTYYLGNKRSTIWYFFRSQRRIRKIVGRIQPDIIHAQDLIFAGVWAYLSGFRPYVLTAWGSDIWHYRRFIFPEKYLLRKTLNNTSFMTAPTKYLGYKAYRIGLDRTKFEVIHFGVDMEIFQKKVSGNLKKKLKINHEKIIFCPRAIGEVYNTDILVDVFYKLSKRIDSKLILLEHNADDNYLLEIEKKIIQYDLVGKVIILPRLDTKQMSETYNLADIVVSISSSDGCPQAFLEAMACEKKIVLTDLPFVREWRQKNNFWVVPVKDKDKTYKTILSALKYPSKKFIPRGKFNRQMVGKIANPELNAQKIISIYRENI